MHPREDDYADLNNAWYLQRNLKGMVDMVVLDDSYHIVTIDRQRHVVVDRTVAFVEFVANRREGARGQAIGQEGPRGRAADDHRQGRRRLRRRPPLGPWTWLMRPSMGTRRVVLHGIGELAHQPDELLDLAFVPCPENLANAGVGLGSFRS